MVERDESAGKSFAEIFRETDVNRVTEVPRPKVIKSPFKDSSQKQANVKAMVRREEISIKRIEIPDKNNDGVISLVTTGNDQLDILMMQINQTYREIRKMEMISKQDEHYDNRVLLESRKVLMAFLKIWLDNKHRNRDIEVADSEDLIMVLQSKMREILEILVEFPHDDCENDCSRRILIAVKGIMRT